MLHTDCPRFFGCNAALCPLEPAWRGVQHLPGERVCYYATESAKAGAAEYHAVDPAFTAVVAVLPEVLAKHPIIRRVVERAAATGSRGRHWRKSTQSGIVPDVSGCDHRTPDVPEHQPAA
jgi:hypothetical protein